MFYVHSLFGSFFGLPDRGKRNAGKGGGGSDKIVSGGGGPISKQSLTHIVL